MTSEQEINREYLMARHCRLCYWHTYAESLSRDVSDAPKLIVLVSSASAFSLNLKR